MSKNRAVTMDSATRDYPYIIERKRAANGQEHRGYVVLAYVGDRQHQPWVTWWEAEDRELYSGHYFTTEDAALHDYTHRIY